MENCKVKEQLQINDYDAEIIKDAMLESQKLFKQLFDTLQDVGTYSKLRKVLSRQLPGVLAYLGDMIESAHFDNIPKVLNKILPDLWL